MQRDQWKMLRRMSDVHRKIEETFTRLVDEPWGRIGAPWHPFFDLYETEDAYIVEADLPGIRPDQVEIEIRGFSVTFRGVRRMAKCVETARRIIKEERLWGRFTRQFNLDGPVDASGISVQYRDGVYRAVLPKREEETDGP